MAIAPTSTAARGDAAQLLYERYYTNVYRYALSQLRSPQDAEDAAQNTFLRAFAALQKGVQPENESAWLFKIAHNVCASSKLAWLRRRRVEAPRDLDLLPVQPATPESRRDELAGLEDALASMPPRLREAFLLREWQGLSYAEIAERLDTSHSAVETLIFRARKMLAQQLEQPGVKRVREALSVAPLLQFIRGLLQATPAAVKAAGAVALLAGAGVAVQPLVTPKHSTPPAATTVVPIAPAIVMSAPQQAASHQQKAANKKKTTSSAAPPSQQQQQQAPQSPQRQTPQQQQAANAPAAGPSPAATAPAPAASAPTPIVKVTSTQISATVPAVPLLPPVTTPAVPAQTLPGGVTTPALPPVTTPGVTTPTLPLETPAVPSVTVPSLPALPSKPLP